MRFFAAAFSLENLLLIPTFKSHCLISRPCLPLCFPLSMRWANYVCSIPHSHYRPGLSNIGCVAIRDVHFFVCCVFVKGFALLLSLRLRVGEPFVRPFWIFGLFAVCSVFALCATTRVVWSRRRRFFVIRFLPISSMPSTSLSDSLPSSVRSLSLGFGLACRLRPSVRLYPLYRRRHRLSLDLAHIITSVTPPILDIYPYLIITHQHRSITPPNSNMYIPPAFYPAHRHSLLRLLPRPYLYRSAMFFGVDDAAIHPSCLYVPLRPPVVFRRAYECFFFFDCLVFANYYSLRPLSFHVPLRCLSS